MKVGTLATYRGPDLPRGRLAVQALADPMSCGGPHLVVGSLEHFELFPDRDQVHAGLLPLVRWNRGW
ncbi:hypothetical protein ACIQB5_51070 [Streptomyces sp. NPDC088560]|uniref:hypothetical protein n=1 Tax=Streptomyces sp. NPDC088560 TaxID=3365868 RepID=UPI003806AD4B